MYILTDIYNSRSILSTPVWEYGTTVRIQEQVFAEILSVHCIFMTLHCSVVRIPKGLTKTYLFWFGQFKKKREIEKPFSGFDGGRVSVCKPVCVDWDPVPCMVAQLYSTADHYELKLQLCSRPSSFPPLNIPALIDAL